jgi:hypothetical protein
MSLPRARVVGNAVYLEYPDDPDAMSVWGEVNQERAEHVADTINDAVRRTAHAVKHAAAAQAEALAKDASTGAVDVRWLQFAAWLRKGG